MCRARESLTKLLNNLLDKYDLGDVCKERNANMDLLLLLYGARVKVYVDGNNKRVFKECERYIESDLFDVLSDLCQ